MTNEIRRIITGIASVIFIMLVISGSDLPRSVFMILMGIIVVNTTIEEWYLFKETKKKMHLIIPILSILSGIYIVIISL